MPATFRLVLLGRHLDKFVRSLELELVLLLSSSSVYFRNLLWHVIQDFHSPNPAVISDMKEDRPLVNSEVHREPVNPPPLVLKTMLKMLYLLGR